MNSDKFNEVVAHRTKKINEILAAKAMEYSREGDRLWNFKRAATGMLCTPEAALLGFMMKHIVSIIDMIDGLDKNPAQNKEDLALWDEKIGDAINYLVLLEGLIRERVDRSPGNSILGASA